MKEQLLKENAENLENKVFSETTFLFSVKF